MGTEVGEEAEEGEGEVGTGMGLRRLALRAGEIPGGREVARKLEVMEEVVDLMAMVYRNAISSQ